MAAGINRTHLKILVREDYRPFKTRLPRKTRVKTTAFFFPFDLFGSSGTRVGVELLADAFQELLEDNRREKTLTRAKSYAGKVRFEEFLFEKWADYADWKSAPLAAIKEKLESEDFLIWTAGNHLGAMPIYEALADRADTLIVQFDAHLDIHHLSDCTEELSHGNFLLHLDAKPNVINVGHRDLLLTAGHIAKSYRAAISAAEIHLDASLQKERLRTLASGFEKIWIDIDCDVFDPAFFPAVAQPLPFGLSPALVLNWIDAIGFGRIAGLSISEFEPARDHRDRSLETLMWMLEYFLLRIHEKAPS